MCPPPFRADNATTRLLGGLWSNCHTNFERECGSSGEGRGLQNRCGASSSMSQVGSTPMHSRQSFVVSRRHAQPESQVSAQADISLATRVACGQDSRNFTTPERA